jgi:hypothetical protein
MRDGHSLEGQEAWIQIAAAGAGENLVHSQGDDGRPGRAMKTRSLDATSYPQIISVLPTV